ncbi:phosphate/phosphite/phosphonate ABC transporter substrate-binding protein [Actinopolymorpha alba]|uniref:phosphate/phosphite/phosphonate ABC transporter substrate-binding protein n=1 Tax=Actinopolymorpha alba TaxID=533267 RepID=UPI00036044CC|nr:phosphate/phosphite/phosphonate ABC transporter substrate-binding protein [Actinopolymorpha alba]
MTTFRTIAALAATAALALGATACGSDGAEPAAAGEDTMCPDGKLRFGVEPFEDAETLIPIYEKLGTVLEEKLDCPVEVQIAESYVGEILAMKNNKLEIGQFGPLGFVFAERQARAIPIVSFADENGDVSSYTGGIWVPKGSEIAAIEDLAGRSLALSEPGSTSGDAVPRKVLIDAGIEKDVKVNYAGGHSEALLALVKGKVDAAEINSQTLASATAEGTFDESKFTQIWESKPILNDPITVSPNLSPELRNAIKEAFLDLKPADVKEIGGYLDFNSPSSNPVVEVTSEDYQEVKDLADALGLTEDDL